LTMGYHLTESAIQGEKRTSAIFPDTPKTHTPDSRLQGLGLRFYSASLARWISRDPIRQDGSENIYAFVLNSPFRYIDPDGRTRTPLPPPPEVKPRPTPLPIVMPGVPDEPVTPNPSAPGSCLSLHIIGGCDMKYSAGIISCFDPGSVRCMSEPCPECEKEKLRAVYTKYKCEAGEWIPIKVYPCVRVGNPPSGCVAPPPLRPAPPAEPEPPLDPWEPVLG
jgi:RHS repeat-associated protein